MRRAPRLVRILSAILLWTVVAFCLVATVVPHFLDRIYYRGPPSAHFDGARFFNPDDSPDGDATLVPHDGGSRAGLIWRQIFGDPTRPAWPDKAPVRPSKPPARVDGGRMLATWIGHATVLVQADGVNILTDPIWSERAGPFGIGPARVAVPGVRFEDLPKIDIVVVSHDHYDHMDVATLKRLWDRDKPRIVTSLGNDAILRSAGIDAVALDWGQENPLQLCTSEVAPLEGCGPSVVVTRNHHWGSRWFADRNRALWSSFVVKLRSGNFFFAGDTGIGDGKWPAEAAALGPVRLAAIPVGAFRFVEGQMASGSHIGPRDAIRVWDGLGRPRALPVHWGTFRLSREGYRTPPELLEAMLGCAGGDAGQFAAAGIGVPVEIAPLSAQPKAPAPDIAAVDRCTQAGKFDALR
jgi:L-ascorbate metabolism protein UlaG (beta-lactamase superfamily)